MPRADNRKNLGHTSPRIKSPDQLDRERMSYLAEAPRFELGPGVNPLAVFKTAPFNHLGTPPCGNDFHGKGKRCQPRRGCVCRKASFTHVGPPI